MADFLSNVIKAQRTGNDLSGQGSSDGIFTASIEGATGVSQSGSFVYAGGKRDIALPMPYDGNKSWIRAIPEAGSLVLAAYRSDIQSPICLNYFNPDPKKRLDTYAAGASLYRPLQPGEIEINSSGGGQSFYSARPLVDHKAGVVRSWLDQDKLESGAKAPLHARLLWEHKAAPDIAIVPPIPGIPNFTILGDMEYFGSVRRPYWQDPKNPLTAGAKAAALAAKASVAKQVAAETAKLNAKIALVSATDPTQVETLTQQLASLTAFGTKFAASQSDISHNFYNYPIPGYTIKVDPLSVAALSAATITAETALAQIPVTDLPTPDVFQIRVFAKEYLRIIDNPLYFPKLLATNPAAAPASTTSMNPKLIDFREGQVFDDLGTQVQSLTSGAFLRASYKYYSSTPVPNPLSVTQIDVDELGNIDWVFSSDANMGWKVVMTPGTTGPSTGGILFAPATAGFTCTSLGPINLSALGVPPILAPLNLTASASISLACGTGYSNTVVSGDHTTIVTLGNHSLAVTGSSSIRATTGITLTSGTAITANATTTMSLIAPTFSLSATSEPATEPMVLGARLSAWLKKLVGALQKGAPVGNMGAPVLFKSDPVLEATLTELATSAEALLSTFAKLSS